MIISHQHRFIFIKTVKTAGTSTEIFLSQHCGDDAIVTPIWPHVPPHRARNHMGWWNPIAELQDSDGETGRQILVNWIIRRQYFNHMRAVTLKHRISPRIWNSYFKFCVDRNPWDKTLSYFHMKRKFTGGKLTLDEHLQKQDFCINLPFYCDEKGGLMVDKVVKYETMTDEFKTIFSALGVPFESSLGVNAKSEYRTDRRPYQAVYTPQQRQIVEQAFAKEIQLHGYAF
jgi:hypothetical protein